MDKQEIYVRLNRIRGELNLVFELLAEAIKDNVEIKARISALESEKNTEERKRT